MLIGIFLMRTENKPDLKNSYFESIFTNSPIGIYIVQNRKFQFANPEFQQILGFHAKELLGKDSFRIILPDDLAFVKENAVNMLKGERVAPYLYRVIDKEGEIRWIMESVASIIYGGKRAVLGYFMDMTERERAKEAMRLSEEKFHKAFRSSPEWMVISTLEDGFYIDVNETFLSTTRYGREEVIGRTSIELGIWDEPRQRIEMVKTLLEQGVVRNLEATFRMRSGEKRFVLWSAEVIDYGDEKCLLAVTRDITDHKRAEQERLHREKLQGVLEVAGATCHELNQPLQSMYCLIEEILEEKPDSKALQELKRQYERITKITRKLNSITTYETKDYVIGSKIIDLDKACKKE